VRSARCSCAPLTHQATASLHGACWASLPLPWSTTHTVAAPLRDARRRGRRAACLHVLGSVANCLQNVLLPMSPDTVMHLTFSTSTASPTCVIKRERTKPGVATILTLLRRCTRARKVWRKQCQYRTQSQASPKPHNVSQVQRALPPRHFVQDMTGPVEAHSCELPRCLLYRSTRPTSHISVSNELALRPPPAGTHTHIARKLPALWDPMHVWGKAVAAAPPQQQPTLHACTGRHNACC
jgi:hypothetical protein